MFIKDKGHTIRNTVREKRAVAHMTQDDLATAVNATRQTIISIEKGNYVPSVLLALKLSEVLKHTVEELFRYEKI